MRALLTGMALAIASIPVTAHAQAILTGEDTRCRIDSPAGVSPTQDVQMLYTLSRGRLVRVGTGFTTLYGAVTRSGSNPDFPVSTASIHFVISTRDGQPDEASHLGFLIGFKAAIGSNLGRLTVRYYWNGALAHEAPAQVDAHRGSAPGEPADALLDSMMPRSAIGDGHGILEVLVFSSLGSVPLFRATFAFDGLGVSDWHRKAAADPGMDATGVRRGGKLPARCGL